MRTPEQDQADAQNANEPMTLETALLEIDQESQAIRTHTLARWKGLAKNDHPLSNEEVIEELASLCSQYRPLKRKLLLVTTPASQGAIGKTEKETYERLITDKEQEIQDLKTDMSIKEGELPVLGEPVGEWEKRLLLVPIAVLLAEALMEVASFQIFAVAWIFGLLISIGLSMGKLMVIKYVDGKLHTAKRTWKKPALVFGTLALVFTVGLFLGRFRNIYLEKSNISVPNGALGFAAVSLIFFGGALAAEYVLYHLRQRVALQRQYDVIKAELCDVVL